MTPLFYALILHVLITVLTLAGAVINLERRNDPLASIFLLLAGFLVTLSLYFYEDMLSSGLGLILASTGGLLLVLGCTVFWLHLRHPIAPARDPIEDIEWNA